MFASTDSPYLFDRSLQGHHEESLPLPQSRPYPSTLFPFPLPSFDHDSISDRALDDHLLGIPMAPAPPPLPTQPKETSANRDMAATAAPRGLHGIKKNSVGVPERMIGAGRRRTPRKDRHSKINTAQGPRDRRMRLSLDVARRFFDLQDILGFDKASRTVEWLLAKSRSAIKDLTGCSPSPLPHSDGVDAKVESTSTSECEVISVSTTDNPTAGETPNAAQEVDTLPSRAKKAVARPPRKTPAHPALARETRLIARARARERTREKMWCRELHDSGQAGQLLSWSSPLQMEGVKPRVHGMNSFLEMVTLGEQAISYLPEPYRTTVQESSEASTQAPVITGAPGQISVFDYMGINVAHDGGGTTVFAQEQGNTQSVR